MRINLILPREKTGSKYLDEAYQFDADVIETDFIVRVRRTGNSIIFYFQDGRDQSYTIKSLTPEALAFATQFGIANATEVAVDDNDLPF